MGPLAWSIIAFRNSLVFHSLDKNTSLFLHWFPAVVAWTQRWHYDPVTEEVIRGDPELKRDWNIASLTQLVFFPMVPYLAWAVAYYAKVSGMAMLTTCICPACASIPGYCLGLGGKTYSLGILSAVQSCAIVSELCQSVYQQDAV